MICTDCQGEEFRTEGDGIACRECNTWYSADDAAALKRGEAPKGRYLSPADEKLFDEVEPVPLSPGSVERILARINFTHAEPWFAEDERILDQNRLEVRAPEIMARLEEQQRALHLVLAFHRGGEWTDDDRAMWKAITGSDDATTRAMCDHIRKALGLKPAACAEGRHEWDGFGKCKRCDEEAPQ